VTPTFVRLTRRALEGGPAEPSNGGECFFYDYTGLHRDVRRAGTVFSVAVSPVRPSPPLQRHAGYCEDIPNAVEAHRDRTLPRPPLYLVRAPVGGTLEPAHGRRLSVFKPPTSIGGTRSKVEGGDRHDPELEGMREDTRHKIYTGSSSQSSYPTSCLEYIARCAWCCPRRDCGYLARYPPLLYIVQGAGS
jgi:hypothetical protein